MTYSPFSSPRDAKMPDGTIERLLNKYEKYPGTFLRVAKSCKVTP